MAARAVTAHCRLPKTPTTRCQALPEPFPLPGGRNGGAPPTFPTAAAGGDGGAWDYLMPQPSQRAGTGVAPSCEEPLSLQPAATGGRWSPPSPSGRPGTRASPAPANRSARWASRLPRPSPYSDESLLAAITLSIRGLRELPSSAMEGGVG